MTLLERYDEMLRRVLSEARGLYGDRLVACAVFGSVGRGTPREDSDIDLLIVARDLPRGRTARVEEFLPVEARVEPHLLAHGSGIRLSAVFKTPEEVEAGSSLFLDMVEDARILDDPEGFWPPTSRGCATGWSPSRRAGSVARGGDLEAPAAGEGADILRGHRLHPHPGVLPRGRRAGL